MEENPGNGVLLYYKYTPLEDTLSAKAWLQTLCQTLGLVGRVRISPQGVNVTVGGSMEALREHIRVVKSHPQFSDCDFKLDSCLNNNVVNSRVALECGFTTLSVRIVEELVTLGPKSNADVALAGCHISPSEFHSILSSAQKNTSSSQTSTLGTNSSHPKRESRESLRTDKSGRESVEDFLTGERERERGREKSEDVLLRERSPERFEDFRTEEGGISGGQRGDENRDGDGRKRGERRGKGGEGERKGDGGESGDQGEGGGGEEGGGEAGEGGERRGGKGGKVGRGEGGEGGERKPVVVLDVRNVYESRIGKFRSLPNVKVLEAPIRQFSDLPDWLEGQAHRLKDRKILMYCTGGVRCESASAHIKSLGPAFADVSQLSGGIIRYLEAYPNGGFFSGKNFVFDHRISVKSNDLTVVGKCLVCKTPYDDYSSRCRCDSCRMLVLICENCQESKKNEVLPSYQCELCSQGTSEKLHENGSTEILRNFVPEEGRESPSNELFPSTEVMRVRGPYSSNVIEVERGGKEEGREGENGGRGDRRGDGSGEGNEEESGKGREESREERREGRREGKVSEMTMGIDENVRRESTKSGGELVVKRKLRVLCLHGFRQSALQFKGRTAGLQKKLRGLVDFVFIDGPHEIPLIYQPREEEKKKKKEGEGEGGTEESLYQVQEVGKKKEGKGEGVRVREGDGEGDREGEGGMEESVYQTQEDGEKKGGGWKGEGEGKREGESENFRRCENSKAKRNGYSVVEKEEEKFEKKEIGTKMGRPRFAWLVDPETLQEREKGFKRERDPFLRDPFNTNSVDDGDNNSNDNNSNSDNKGISGEDKREFSKVMRAEKPFPPLQYMTQKGGWEKTKKYILEILENQGPFDGLMGFSQGASVVSALSFLVHGGKKEEIVRKDENGGKIGKGNRKPPLFSFVILCSGFCFSADSEFEKEILRPDFRIFCPSLHIFGSLEEDKQISKIESENLVQIYEEKSRVVVRHEFGHIIPIKKTFTNIYRDFFQTFLR